MSRMLEPLEALDASDLRGLGASSESLKSRLRRLDAASAFWRASSSFWRASSSAIACLIRAAISGVIGRQVPFSLWNSVFSLSSSLSLTSRPPSKCFKSSACLIDFHVPPALRSSVPSDPSRLRSSDRRLFRDPGASCSWRLLVGVRERLGGVNERLGELSYLRLSSSN